MKSYELNIGIIRFNKELLMPMSFREFSIIFDQFEEKYPKDPLIEEIRSKISSGRFPKPEWMLAKAEKMTRMLSPLWLQTQSDPVDNSDRHEPAA